MYNNASPFSVPWCKYTFLLASLLKVVHSSKNCIFEIFAPKNYSFYYKMKT